MSKYGSSSLKLFLVGGYNLLSAKVKNASVKREATQELSHGLGDEWEESTPTGMRKATLVQDGAFFDDSAASMHVAMKNTKASSVAVFGVEGNTAGKHFVGHVGAIATAYEPMASLGALTKANVTYVVSGAQEYGVILQPLAAQTEDWDTEDGSIDYTDDTAQRVVPITSNSKASPSVVTTPIAHGLTTGDVVLISGVSGSDADINGEQTVTVITDTTFSVAVDASTSGGTGGQFVRADSSNGGAGYLQVTALSGITGFVGKIRDSADDTTFADLVTFSNVTAAPNAQRVAVTGQVDRYLAFSGDVTGTGLITVFAGFARA